MMVAYIYIYIYLFKFHPEIYGSETDFSSFFLRTEGNHQPKISRGVNFWLRSGCLGYQPFVSWGWPSTAFAIHSGMFAWIPQNDDLEKGNSFKLATSSIYVECFGARFKFLLGVWVGYQGWVEDQKTIKSIKKITIVCLILFL